MGREVELAQLQAYFARAANGVRQVVIVTGEPGIGKTTVLDAFVAQLAAGQEVRLARGQCVEQYGPGEAYRPVLEGFERLCQGADRDCLLPLLRQYAPLWLAQLPAMLCPEEGEALQRQLLGATRERMLREMAMFLEILTADTPLLLVLEDLHWSDPSTLELLATLARRREPARLLVLGAYRPMEILNNQHPLAGIVRELQAHGQCQELALQELSEAAVDQYLRLRFAGEPSGRLSRQQLAAVLHQRTEGHPLFLVNTVEDLVKQGVLVQEESGWTVHGTVQATTIHIPSSIRQLLTRQMERLAPEAQLVLEAASVAGAEFSAATVAAAVRQNLLTIEERCERLAQRQQFLRPTGIEEWPDGTAAARYGFRHALYQQLWHERVTLARQREWHQRIGLRKEQAYAGRSQEIAVELAVHFEQGREYERAVQSHRQAAEMALRRSAPSEALRHVNTALTLLRMLPESRERTRQELELHLMLGSLQMATQGYAAPEMAQTYARARDLCYQIGQPPHQLFYALLGLFAFHLMRTELDKAYTLAEQLSALAYALQDPALCAEASLALGAAEFHRGNFVQAHEHFERGVLWPPPQPPHTHLIDFGQDPWVACYCYDAFALAPLGYLDQAQQKLQHASDRAQELAHPFSLAFCLEVCCHIAQFRGETHAVYRHAQAYTALSAEYGFHHREATGSIYRGWALTAQRRMNAGLEQIRQGLVAYRAVKATLLQPLFLAFLVEAASRGRHIAEGLTAVTEALELTQRTGERFYEAELYRLKGQLTLQQEQGESQKGEGKKQKKTLSSSQLRTSRLQAEAEAYFLKAIEIARKQHAKLLELRAVMSLSRLWMRQGKRQRARQLLAEVYGWFTEGFSAADLREAKALLAELA